MTAAVFQATRGLTVKDRLDRLSMPEPMSGCWLWLGSITNKGYGTLRIRRRSYQAHRVSWREFNGDIPGGMCVLHRCDMPSCINPDHLFLGSQIENLLDMRQKGRQVIGSRVAGAKLTNRDVVLIRNDTSHTFPELCHLASQFGVSFTTIYDIKARRTWKHI